LQTPRQYSPYQGPVTVTLLRFGNNSHHFGQSECQSCTQLDIPRCSHTSVPYSEARARHISGDRSEIGVEGGVLLCAQVERMPVPQIEELCSDLEPDSLRNLCVLNEREILVVIWKATEIAHPRPLP